MRRTIVPVPPMAFIVLCGCINADIDRRDVLEIVIDTRVPTDTLGVAETVILGGDAAADERHVLFNVYSGDFVNDGSVIVANRGGFDLRLFSVTGDFINSMGRQGNGPGEFQRIQLVRALPGDSILVYDGAHSLFSVFDQAGTYSRSIGFPELENMPRTTPSVPWMDVTEEGIVFAVSTFVEYLKMDPGGPPKRDSVTIVVMSMTGDLLRQSDGIANRWWEKVYNPNAHRVRAVDGPFAVVGTHEGTMLLADNNEPRVLIRRDSDRTIGAWTFEGLRRRPVDDPPDNVQGPYFEHLVVSDDSRVWVGEAVVGTDGNRRWHVVDIDGGRVGTTGLPATVQILAIRGPHVLVRDVNPHGHETVSILALVAPPRRP